MKVVSHIAVWSLARLVGVVYAVLGLIAGFFVSVITMFTTAWTQDMGPLFGLFFGGAAFVFFPILYGVIGFLVGAFVGLIYNVAADTIGGLRLEVKDV